MTVRRLAPPDHAGWSAMRQRLWPDHGRDDLADLNRMHVPNTVLVAERDGALVGFAEATVRSVVDGLYFEPGAFLEGIWVAPQARRTGVATALLAAVVEWARGHGLDGIGSDAHVDNVASIAWHRRMGFAIECEVVKLVRKFDPAGDD